MTSSFDRQLEARVALKKSLQSRKWVHGTWNSIPHAGIVEILAKSGLDFIGMDIEHGTHDFDAMQRVIAATQAEGLCSLARVPSPNGFEMMRRVMDHGADGIIAPMIETPDQVKAVIDIVKFPPRGKRSYGVNRAHGYGFDFDRYVKSWNDSSLVFIQIESMGAAQSIEKLIDFPEVDGVMIGLYDLSGSIGKPGELDHPDVRAACKKIVAACAAKGKSVGTHLVEIDEAKLEDAKSLGYTFSIFASDVFILWKWAEKARALIDRRG